MTTSATLSPAAMDAQMEALLSGEFDALSTEERAPSLARTGTESGKPSPIAGEIDDEDDDDRDEILPAGPPEAEAEPPVDPFDAAMESHSESGES